MATRPTLMGTHGAVATEHYLSTQAGLDILRAGGNAADAAVAATLVECLVNAHVVTFGGELLGLVAQGHAVHCIDGNTVTPADATIASFTSRGYETIPDKGILAAGPPGTPHALLTLLARFGTMTFAEVAERAIELADEGFPMHAGLLGPDPPGSPYDLSIAGNVELFRGWPGTAALYLPGGAPPLLGARFRNPDMARTWRRMCEAEKAAGATRVVGLERAAEAFYRGAVAERMAAHAQALGGLLRLEDIEGYESLSLPPVVSSYRGYDVYKCGPATQGPVLLQQLALLEGFDLAAMPRDGADFVHTVVECAKLAFADREAYYGDPRFVDVPLTELLSPQYADVRRALVGPQASLDLVAGDPRGLHPRAHPVKTPSWGAGTVSVQVVDASRMMVSLSPSGAWIGWSPVVEGLGFPLGTRLQMMVLDPSHPNALMPGKRPRTTLTPTIVLKDGRPHICVGTPGADQQDQWNLQVLLGLLDFGLDVQEALEAPRFSSAHFPSSFFGHKASPGELRLESRFEAAVQDALAARGHILNVRPPFSEGATVAIRLDPTHDVVQAGADPRPAVNHQHLPAWCAVW